jgi:hypothetical protein
VLRDSKTETHGNVVVVAADTPIVIRWPSYQRFPISMYPVCPFPGGNSIRDLPVDIRFQVQVSWMCRRSSCLVLACWT